MAKSTGKDLVKFDYKFRAFLTTVGRRKYVRKGGERIRSNNDDYHVRLKAPFIIPSLENIVCQVNHTEPFGLICFAKIRLPPSYNASGI